jgi:hypothetical protein
MVEKTYLLDSIISLKNVEFSMPDGQLYGIMMWLLLAQPFGFLSIAKEKLETSLTKALKCTASPETQACPPFLLPYRYLIA